MLAQGQSSSAKRGGLAVVSSGLIFLKKKKRKKEMKLFSQFHLLKCLLLVFRNIIKVFLSKILILLKQFHEIGKGYFL